MSQTINRDLEGGNNRVDGHRGYPPSTPNQPVQGESNFGDSSGPFFSIYSKCAEEEDNNMVERWQKDADGILIFTGLFSAAVAALLAVTVLDLRPVSQDTSAFYLGNIYEVLADPNATPVAKPPPFSAPRYAVWVNSLWFLSLVMSLSCAMWATSLHQWARRYIRLTQPPRCSPEKRARMRAFFADGVDKMHIPWAVEGLPALLHLSLFLFFGGLVIYLFNVDQEVFMCVVWWIGLFTMVYGLITLLPLIRHNSPYYAPLSPPAWFLYSSIQHVTFSVLSFITYRYGFYETWDRCDRLRGRYRGWMLGGVEKAVKEGASERSSEIDGSILGWTISALGDDDSLEKFFAAIPGLFNSKLVYHLQTDLPGRYLSLFWLALDGFMGRTLYSNSVTDSVKSRRDIICRDIISMVPCPSYYMYADLLSHVDKAPVSIERLQAMARWFTHVSPEEHDKRWIALVGDVCELAAHDIERNVAMGGDDMLLATLIDVSREQVFIPGMFELVGALARIDIVNTQVGLQHDFCTLWNELVQVAKNRGYRSNTVRMLHSIRHLYITLHQGIDATPTAFSSTRDYDGILFDPSSYPLCDIASHRPDVPLLTQSPDSFNVSHRLSTSSSRTISRQFEEASIIAGPPSPPGPIKPSEIGDSSRAPTATSPALPVHTSPHLADVPPPGAVVATLQDIHPTATDIDENLSHAPTPTMASAPASDTLILNKPLKSRDADTACASDPLPPDSSVVSVSIPASSPSRVRPLPKISSRPTGNATLLRLRARGLVNSGNMCFVNAVLHLLVHSPPFLDLFRELGDLKGQHEAEGMETGGDATPLVDATLRFFEEFMFNDKEQPQQVVGGKSREDEETKKEHSAVDSFKPTYMYDAMKEKGQLKKLLDGKHKDAEDFLGLFLDALDEEMVELRTYISTHKPASAPSVKELEEEVQSTEDQSEAGKQDYAASPVKSPISRIFGGRSLSTICAPSKPDTIIIKPWRSLKLFIQPDSVHTIQDALAHLAQPQPVQAGQSSSSEASKQVLLEALPPVLVLHLERFLHDAATGGINKINKLVQFGPELEIPQEVMAPVAGKSAEAVHYKLYGVLYHHGESAGSGHYTVSVLHPNGESGSGETWFLIDNETVNTVGHEDVFGGDDNERVDNQRAYMLFYCRTAPASTR